MRTQDGGITWEMLVTGSLGASYDIQFVDSLHGWIGGNEGNSVRYTSNGGGKLELPIIRPSIPPDAFFTDLQNGWAIGALGNIIHTSNGGYTWTQQESGTGKSLFGVNFSDTQHGCVVGDDGEILLTFDGETWHHSGTGR
ncbi:MAG: hypothetical protein R2759_18000 [Bacteroidales bacterium]